jgi:recombination protein RecA
MESMKRTKRPVLSVQVKRHANTKSVKEEKEYDGSNKVISTGSTLLDLAISGGRFRGGGIPAGILVEIFGPSGAGKTVLLCELAGAIRRMQGDVQFHDPEARINQQFARIFGLNFDSAHVDYQITKTIPEVFQAVRKWKPESWEKMNGVFADSLAALSTDLEAETDEGDKMGMRRAKEFSQELRRTCSFITEKNLLMVCSNQIRQNSEAGAYGQKYTSPGGMAIGFYASLRLKVNTPQKQKDKEKLAGKEITRVTGVQTEVEVYKSSVWKPYRTAPVTISFDYGIDDIRENLKFIKTYSGQNFYTVGEEKMSNSLDESISIVETANLEKQLKNEVIDRWEEIELLFKKDRKPKMR